MAGSPIPPVEFCVPPISHTLSPSAAHSTATGYSLAGRIGELARRHALDGLDAGSSNRCFLPRWLRTRQMTPPARSLLHRVHKHAQSLLIPGLSCARPLYLSLFPPAMEHSPGIPRARQRASSSLSSLSSLPSSPSSDPSQFISVISMDIGGPGPGAVQVV
ncbi:hypothetical protein HCEG_03693 [Histoplasma capsulatum var. duboisii H88]|uniref:Uncharacterized protein n=2 Tax=Ajellomyces capsulatus (strain H88) TaxID=544711 RepID=F0UDQ5_AJEC8|nr:hypothetical protein HCEG_03693 [Histoplasma capsulatum var. duboisii H88]